MRNLILNPREVLYTEDLADSETIEGALAIAGELRKGRKIREPVQVMRFKEFDNRYVLFNGNRRTRAAEICGLQLKAMEIENQEDFQVIQRIQPTSWHVINREEILKFNGDYFCNNLDYLKQRGLFCSAYHRAKKRIKDAVKTFYQWLS